MDPDSGGPKTYGSDGSGSRFGSGSETLKEEKVTCLSGIPPTPQQSAKLVQHLYLAILLTAF